MKQLKCTDVGGSCDHIASGDNDQDTVTNMFKHVAAAHAHLLQGTTEEQRQDLEQKMFSLVEG